MPVTFWTKYKLDKLRELYPDHGSSYLAETFKTTAKAISSAAKKHGIKKSPGFNRMQFRKDAISEMDKNIVIKLYPLLPNPVIGRLIGRTEASIQGIAVKYKLKKPPGFVNTGCLKKGNVPPNKGKKWDEYLPKEIQERVRATTFKKGQLPPNTLNDGVITIRKDSKGRRYKWIRIGLAKWQMLHVHNWEKQNGKVPPGHILVFITDSMNCDPSNLRLITNAQHMEETRNKDGFIATRIAANGRGSYDKKLKEEILKYPELIELKRNQLKLNKQIKTK
jgi:hypothetical protein